MKAVTLHQARAWDIMHGDKRVENRTWRPSSKYIGQRLAIHAGTNKGHKDAQKWIRRRHRHAPDKWPSGILGTVKVVGVVHKDPRTGRTSYEGANDLKSRLKVRRAMNSPHFHGPYGWILDDPRPLQVPVPHNGKLMLWTPDKWDATAPDKRPSAALMRREVRRQVAEVRKAGPGGPLGG